MIYRLLKLVNNFFENRKYKPVYLLFAETKYFEYDQNGEQRFTGSDVLYISLYETGNNKRKSVSSGGGNSGRTQELKALVKQWESGLNIIFPKEYVRIDYVNRKKTTKNNLVLLNGGKDEK